MKAVFNLKQLLSAFVFSAFALQSFAEVETPVKSSIESLALFKNGVVAASRSIEVAKPGRYLVDAPMRPIHGTFWLAPGAKAEVFGELRLMDKPNTAPMKSLQATLLGRDAVFKYRDGDKTLEARGKVVDVFPAKGPKKWSLDYASGGSGEPQPDNGASDFISLRQADGKTVLLNASILSVETDGVNQSVKEERPVFIFDVKEKPEGGKIYFSYLSKGAAWAPAYRLRLLDDSKMTVSLSASVRNELEDFEGAELRLVAGQPNMAAGDIPSLLCADETLADFFKACAGEAPRVAKRFDNFAAPRMAAAGLAASAPDLESQPGDSSDTLVFPVGKASMKEGGSKWFELLSEEASYERIVECRVPEIPAPPFAGSREAAGKAELWDSLRFKNPFKTPMTAAPAEISDKSGFLGQGSCLWANPGEETLLRVAKALSVTAKSVEQDLNRSETTVGKNVYAKITVKGALTLKNSRPEAAKLSTRLDFSGELCEADGSPKCELRDGGGFSVNRSQTLVWESSLKPGEEAVLNYSYFVLARR